MRVGSLFAGIGGFDLGLERAGMEVKWQVELDPFCRSVLEKHWPKVRRHDDVKTFPPASASDWHVDLVCGGFPCQPVSVAGQQRGDADERWLWPEMRRVCEVLRPRWVLAENVPGLLSADAGRLFGEVVRDLAALGYAVEWDCIPAAAVGAPHIRDRVWIVAHAGVTRNDGRGSGRGDAQAPRPRRELERCGTKQMADSDKQGLALRQGERGHDESERKAIERGGGQSVADPQSGRRDEPPSQVTTGDSKVHGRQGEESPIALGGFGSDKARSGWPTEPNVGRVADGVPARVDRLRCLGNAVVPQVVEWIGRRIMEHHTQEEFT